VFSSTNIPSQDRDLSFSVSEWVFSQIGTYDNSTVSHYSGE
jgi:hypothetical protein